MCCKFQIFMPFLTVSEPSPSVLPSMLVGRQLKQHSLMLSLVGIQQRKEFTAPVIFLTSVIKQCHNLTLDILVWNGRLSLRLRAEIKKDHLCSSFDISLQSNLINRKYINIYKWRMENDLTYVEILLVSSTGNIHLTETTPAVVQ